MQAEAGPSMSKEKRTRRRLRVSCVECTKRRQKCDRQTPCGLCVSRGVAHLCKWESQPVSRPAPARPPVNAIPVDRSPRDSRTPPAPDAAKVAEMHARIVHMERTILAQADLILRAGIDIDSNALAQHSQRLTQRTAPLHTIAPADESESDADSECAPLGGEVHEAAMALAQLSLGTHHGEYYGRGTVVHALHDANPQRSNSVFQNDISTGTTPPFAGFSTSLRALVQSIPPPARTAVLLDAYFEDVNWRFGLPQPWFLHARDDMLRVLALPGATGLEINVHWLCLFFAVLALAPQSPLSHLPPYPPPDATYSELYPPTNTPQGHKKNATSREFFTLALSARRLAKDAAFALPPFTPVPATADGTVLSSLAAPLLCAHLADHGRVSEAWKLLGGSIRAAQAVGMHSLFEARGGGGTGQGGKAWRRMCEEERVLRTAGWWGLVVWDRLYSFVLGRPTMIQRGPDTTTTLALGLDASPVPAWRAASSTYQTELVKLSDIVAEAMDRCLGPSTDAHASFATVSEICQKFDAWEAALPEQYRWRQWWLLHIKLGRLLTAASQPLHEIRRCYLINTWYLACRMNLHRSYITQATATATHGHNHGHNPNSAPHSPHSPHSPCSSTSRADLARSHLECIALATDLLRLQCITHDSAIRNASRRENAAWTGNGWAFEVGYYLFDAGVTLMSGLARIRDIAAREGADPRGARKRGREAEREAEGEAERKRETEAREREKEAQELVDRAVLILEKIGREDAEGEGGADGGKRDIALRAVEVLEMLGRELGWRSVGDPGLGGGEAAKTAKATADMMAETQAEEQGEEQQQYGYPHTPQRSQSPTPPLQQHAPQTLLHPHAQMNPWPAPPPPNDLLGNGNGDAFAGMPSHGSHGLHSAYSSYNFIPQSPLDTSNIPLSRFFSAPQNALMMNSLSGSVLTEQGAGAGGDGMAQGMAWGHFPDGLGEYWGTS
ncbi:hypothetical protein FIBSPDRAFT_932896 [Athelia psychrophila]|uniref:Zn(2)-C6 fungal-type domain-containing protein n=1 Tax=Athelia psychrophila TaxID=1759441 RepID=A0A166HYS5_9AGAM|nr:hypothetical protein FIBSPDRAFT_932896 [Fibularhizoctonia sp. CBS 109695]